MQLRLGLPEKVSAILSRQWGDVRRRALEAVAVEACRSGALTNDQVREWLGFETLLDVEAPLKPHQAAGADAPIASPDRDFVRVGRSRIQGRGVFAKRRIPRGTRVIEYIGDRVPLASLMVRVGDGASTPIYALRLNETTAIDGSLNGNDARFVNHSCAPNCEVYVFDDHAYVYAMAEIVTGCRGPIR